MKNIILLLTALFLLCCSVVYAEVEIPPATNDIGIRVLSVESHGHFGMLKLKLTNNGYRPVKGIAVVIVFYDTESEIIDAVLLPLGKPLLPGQAGIINKLLVIPNNTVRSHLLVYQAEYYN